MQTHEEKARFKERFKIQNSRKYQRLTPSQKHQNTPKRETQKNNEEDSARKCC
jgi:ribosomal protein L35